MELDTGMNKEVKAGCELCVAMGAGVDGGDIDWHRLGAEAAGGLVVELVDLVEMVSEGGTVGESLDAQGTLVNVWKMCLRVEGSLERVVRPIDTVCAGVVPARSQKLGLEHALGERSKWYRG
jgi:hypothetical protein